MSITPSTPAETARGGFKTWVNSQRKFVAPPGQFSVEINTIEFSRRPDLTSPSPNISAIVKNFGRTPAYEVANWTAIASGTYPPKDPLPQFDTPSIRKITLNAGASFEIITHIPRAFRAEEIAMIESGERRLYFYGRIEYRDAFERQHTTKFCMMFGGKETSDLRSGLTWCDDGNEAD